jgi:hypothetical protein
MSLRARMPSLSWRYLMFAATVFLGAFLLFLIQPIAGKHLLPWFGGSSSVWAMSLLFFTATLFLGYLYVYFLTQARFRTQALIHGSLVVAGSIYALSTYALWGSLFPSLEWTIAARSPAMDLLLALVQALGIPYFLLSTTGPLLQYWYAGTEGREPYKLYALSNFASLIALVAFPFYFELHFKVGAIENIWVLCFVLYGLLSIAVCAIAYTKRSHEVGTATSANISWPMIGAWVGLAALPALALVATTTQLTQAIAPVPLLWIVPLTIYLLTFIIAFAGWGRSVIVPLLMLFASIAAYLYIPAGPFEIVPKIASYLLLLFATALACHAALYRLRPASGALPLFYVILSLGGMLGTMCASVIAPIIFSDFYEFPLTVALAAALAGAIVSEGFFPRMMHARSILITRWLFGASAISVFIILVASGDGTTKISTRNFYGNAAVRFDPARVSLIHGTTMHGVQFADKALAHAPTTYYTALSGIGRALTFERSLAKQLRVGTIGLGTGSIAAYCRPGDSFVFYEIDPRINVIAHTYFSYVDFCKGAEVREGDARILLEKERRAGDFGSYDVLAVDAFTDDTIPTHLLTEQAVSLYISHVHSNKSIIAIHVSNRYLDLAPIVLRLAAQEGLSALYVYDRGESDVASASEWVLLAKDGSIFRSPLFAQENSELPKASSVVWTDDSTSLLPALKVQLPW